MSRYSFAYEYYASAPDKTAKQDRGVVHKFGRPFAFLTYCILVDSSTVMCWTSPFVISITSILSFYSSFNGKSC